MKEFKTPTDVLSITDEEWTNYIGSYVDFFDNNDLLVRSQIIKYIATPYANSDNHTYTHFVDENGVSHSLIRIKRIL